MEKILIDRFIVPKEAEEEFFQRVKFNRSFIKELPGFVKDSAFIREENDTLIFVTVAIWESQDAIENAKKAVFAEYQKQNFDLAGMLHRLGISMERDFFDPWKSEKEKI